MLSVAIFCSSKCEDWMKSRWQTLKLNQLNVIKSAWLMSWWDHSEAMRFIKTFNALIYGLSLLKYNMREIDGNGCNFNIQLNLWKWNYWVKLIINPFAPATVWFLWYIWRATLVNLVFKGLKEFGASGSCCVWSHHWDCCRSFVFKPQNKDVTFSGSHMTRGIDMYVTEERTILLDSQVGYFNPFVYP